jgi:hypothetical protein
MIQPDKTLARLVDQALSWYPTKQGAEFWGKVYDYFYEMAYYSDARPGSLKGLWEENLWRYDLRDPTKESVFHIDRLPEMVKYIQDAHGPLTKEEPFWYYLHAAFEHPGFFDAFIEKAFTSLE